MPVELRCNGTMHGKLVDDRVEIKCRRRTCGFQPGMVVLHFFNIHTGNLVGTRRFADPGRRKR